VHILYIAGPYRAATPYRIQQKIEAARAVALKYWKTGEYAVICPHANTALMDGEAPDEVWLAGDIEIMKRCDGVVMLPNWKESAGAREEHRVAKELGLTILYEGEEP
jgi:hypothetical protein